MGKFNSLEDKVIVIAGGAKNLGGLLSTTYAKDGAKLVIHYHDEKSLDDAKATLSKVEELGGEGTLFSGDLTKVSNVQALFQHAEETFGKVDIAINTVGKVLKKPISETTEEEFDSMADINAKSAYFFIKYAEKAMNDNAIAESTFKAVKTEFIYSNRFRTLDELNLQLSDYINWFNHHRIHGSLNYQTPVSYRLSTT